jgi:NADH:ubiquinone oxidoreductase subunit E
MEIDLTKVDSIVDQYEADRGLLISMLQDIQAEYSYLPQEALIQVSRRLEVPVSQIFGVASFYRAFSLKPRGRHLIHVCLGTACHVRGGKRILDRLERSLNISAGDTTEDRRFTLETVNCLGACALGPIVVVDKKYFGKIRPDGVEKILKDYK